MPFKIKGIAMEPAVDRREHHMTTSGAGTCTSSSMEPAVDRREHHLASADEAAILDVVNGARR